MGQVIQFIPKADLERAHLIREARAIYDSIFPPTDAVGEQSHGRPQARQVGSPFPKTNK